MKAFIENRNPVRERDTESTLELEHHVLVGSSLRDYGLLSSNFAHGMNPAAKFGYP